MDARVSDGSPGAPAPGLAIVLVTDGREAIEGVLASLAAQTAQEQLEVVIVAPRDALSLEPSEAAPFGAVRVLETESVVPLHRARAAGVTAASAPIVIVGETHAFPEPEWAAALIEAHSGPWAAVVPLIENSNPRGAISWSNFLLTYGPWSWSRTGELDKVPEQNTAFKRDVLLRYGPRLPHMLDSGSGLSVDLRSRGERFRLEPAARVRHLNVSRAASWLPERFCGGRAFGATRAAEWSLLRRVTYAAGFPLITPVFFVRALRGTRWPSWQRQAPGLTLPSLFLGVLAWAVGEALGYVSGVGRAEARMADYEINRRRYVASSR